MDKIKRIDIKEFREKGYLQELNRQFLHPLGMALEIVAGPNGEETLGGIWDYRDVPEGMHYGLEDSDEERRDRFFQNSCNVTNELAEKFKVRIEKFGFAIEPIIDKDGNVIKK
jgi:hypothetical protein